MEQISRRSRTDVDLDESLVMPAPRRDVGPHPLPVEHDDDPDGDLRATPEPSLFGPEIATPATELAPVDPVAQARVDGAVGTRAADEELTERESQILVFEKRWWRHAGAKEQAIREQFDLSATRYYQVLNTLLDSPAALAREPVLVGRLRRLRGSRIRARGR